METISKKMLSIQFDGKKYRVDNDLTIDNIIEELGISKNSFIFLKPTKEGFVLGVKEHKS